MEHANTGICSKHRSSFFPIPCRFGARSQFHSPERPKSLQHRRRGDISSFRQRHRHRRRPPQNSGRRRRARLRAVHCIHGRGAFHHCIPGTGAHPGGAEAPHDARGGDRDGGGGVQ